MDDKIKVVLEMTVSLTTQDVDDIMASALEGGINYWCSEAEVVEKLRAADWGHEQIARGGKLLLHLHEPFDESGTEVYELTLEKFVRGFKMWLENGGASSGAIVDEGIDTCTIDAVSSDTIIQYAVFGEPVFG